MSLGLNIHSGGLDGFPACFEFSHFFQYWFPFICQPTLSLCLGFNRKHRSTAFLLGNRNWCTSFSCFVLHNCFFKLPVTRRERVGVCYLRVCLTKSEIVL